MTIKLKYEQGVKLETNLNDSSNFFLKMIGEMDEQNNDLLPCHALLYCYVNIVYTAHFTSPFLSFKKKCFPYCALQNNANI